VRHSTSEYDVNTAFWLRGAGRSIRDGGRRSPPNAGAALSGAWTA